MASEANARHVDATPTAPFAASSVFLDTTGALPAGSAVGSFVLRELIERDEVCLRYRATSSASADAEVVIEEYWPAWVERGPQGEPQWRESELAALFEAGLAAFVEEAGQLARIEHPALGRIGPLWRARGTAYRLVEPRARRLGAYLQRRTRPPDERWLRTLAESLLGALDAVHRAGRIHGDVRPAQVLLREDDAAVLLDFGAARSAIARLAAWRAPHPEPAFVAPEWQLYGSVPKVSADLYALAALLWFASTGELPEPPTARAASLDDGASSRWSAVLRRQPSLRLGAAWMNAIEAALAFDAELRPQSVEAFRRLLAEPLDASRSRWAAVTASLPASPAARSPSLPLSAELNALDARRPSPVEPSESVKPELSSRPAPFDAGGSGWPALHADVDDREREREPLWQLPEFTTSAAPSASPGPGPTLPRTARADEALWPNEAHGNSLFEAPASPSDGPSWGSRKPAPVARRSRYGAWAVAGALVGGLMLGLGIDHIWDEFQFERLLRQAPTAGGPERPVAAAPALPVEPAPPAPPAESTTHDAKSMSSGTTVIADPGGLSAVRDGTTVLSPEPSSPVAPVAPVRPVEATEPEPLSQSPSPNAAATSTVAPVRAGAPSAPPPHGATAAQAKPPARTAAVAEHDPATACAPRTNFALYMCMKTQCERSAWFAHSQCVQLRRDDQR